MMKASGFWVLVLLLGTVLVLVLNVSSSRNGNSYPDFVFNHTGDGPKRIAISRKFKENGYTPSTQKKGNVRNVNLDDYHPIDPSPSSKASIKPGPIEHGTPIIPYIPKPLPPAQPSPGATP
ncbi:unnamed protein product [Prunus armeniaca]|uniref:Uncharacterized protein n=1 Tax=Prunus armeniaca TaxID=36596 RepID=A0A6J5W8P4_PRUAR|nr:hypothetical protein GBA52_015568 [Prunus armeniaca]CAB4266223.1 unnamed protein product [Prunus armeniaca]CAB4296803.1 unnamed protein product [Prunus armeniaca]